MSPVPMNGFCHPDRRQFNLAALASIVDILELEHECGVPGKYDTLVGKHAYMQMMKFRSYDAGIFSCDHLNLKAKFRCLSGRLLLLVSRKPQLGVVVCVSARISSARICSSRGRWAWPCDAPEAHLLFPECNSWLVRGSSLF